jgi:hypothetical protein
MLTGYHGGLNFGLPQYASAFEFITQGAGGRAELGDFLRSCNLRLLYCNGPLMRSLTERISHHCNRCPEFSDFGWSNRSGHAMVLHRSDSTG